MPHLGKELRNISTKGLTFWVKNTQVSRTEGFHSLVAVAPRNQRLIYGRANGMRVYSSFSSLMIEEGMALMGTDLEQAC